MHREIREFVQNCSICQQAKSTYTLPARLLQPLPIPCQVWEDISKDFTVGLPQVQRLSVIMVVVDRLSKFAHFIAINMIIAMDFLKIL